MLFVWGRLKKDEIALGTAPEAGVSEYAAYLLSRVCVADKLMMEQDNFWTSQYL